MKTKILIIALLLSCTLTSKAQITLDHVYAVDIPDRSVKLALSGLKYISLNRSGTLINYFTIYNPDHSIFKTIVIPFWPGKTPTDIQYVSETLFDLDTLVEYEVTYTTTSASGVRICNENANILLQIDSGFIANTSLGTSDKGFIPAGIFPNGTDTKLMITKQHFSGVWSAQIEVYNLPGQLPCLECSNGLITGMATNNPTVTTSQPKPFPNPSTDYFNIKYILPADAKSVFMEIYDMQGSMVKKSRLNNKSNQTTVSNDELTTGQFIYRIIADGKLIVTDKIMVTK